MSFVLIAPEFVTAAAGDLTNLGSSISAANASAASATTGWEFAHVVRVDRTGIRDSSRGGSDESGFVD
ncbi:PE domain-containing protein [Mycobacterium tuberculosis]